MKLHHLTVTAFGPFAGTESVDFDALNDAGLFLLSGATGAGKTSILDAVCFALYGAVPGVRGVKTLKSQHAEDDDPAGGGPGVQRPGASLPDPAIPRVEPSEATRHRHAHREGLRVAGRADGRRRALPDLPCRRGRADGLRADRHACRAVPAGGDAAPGRLPEVPARVLPGPARGAPAPVPDRPLRPHRGVGQRPQPEAAAAVRGRRDHRPAAPAHARGARRERPARRAHRPVVVRRGLPGGGAALGPWGARRRPAGARASAGRPRHRRRDLDRGPRAAHGTAPGRRRGAPPRRGQGTTDRAGGIGRPGRARGRRAEGGRARRCLPALPRPARPRRVRPGNGHPCARHRARRPLDGRAARPATRPRSRGDLCRAARGGRGARTHAAHPGRRSPPPGPVARHRDLPARRDCPRARRDSRHPRSGSADP